MEYDIYVPGGAPGVERLQKASGGSELLLCYIVLLGASVGM